MDLEQFMTMLGLSDLQFALAVIGLLILISQMLLKSKLIKQKLLMNTLPRRVSQENLPLARDLPRQKSVLSLHLVISISQPPRFQRVSQLTLALIALLPCVLTKVLVALKS